MQKNSSPFQSLVLAVVLCQKTNEGLVSYHSLDLIHLIQKMSCYFRYKFSGSLEWRRLPEKQRQNKKTGFQSVLSASAIPPSVPHKMNHLV